jgi:hypothetical protein
LMHLHPIWKLRTRNIWALELDTYAPRPFSVCHEVFVGEQVS